MRRPSPAAAAAVAGPRPVCSARAPSRPGVVAPRLRGGGRCAGTVAADAPAAARAPAPLWATGGVVGKGSPAISMRGREARRGRREEPLATAGERRRKAQWSSGVRGNEANKTRRGRRCRNRSWMLPTTQREQASRRSRGCRHGPMRVWGIAEEGSETLGCARTSS